MSNSQLPERASLEFLRKLAKERLRTLREADGQAKLADALLAIAREHGFSSWRALKAEVERREEHDTAAFFEACRTGDVSAVAAMLEARPEWAAREDPSARHRGWTGLHTAAKQRRPEVARLLLERGADPNAREAGDNTTPLHWAAAQGEVDVVRALLDAGGDVHGYGDVHELDAIGWAAYFPADDGRSKEPIVSLLVERGARHHIFSAMSVGDAELVRSLAEADLAALDRRMSRFEHGLTPLHFAIQRGRYDLLDLLIELGANLEAVDAHGQTALGAATIRGDREAKERLQAAGAVLPRAPSASGFRETAAGIGDSVRKGVPMIRVPDIAAALAWYVSIGFQERGRFEDGGIVNFGMVSFGGAELMFAMHGLAGKHDVSLWFYTDQIDRLYQAFVARQVAAMDSGRKEDGIEFVEEIYDPFYGGRQFSIRDPNGYELIFLQPG